MERAEVLSPWVDLADRQYPLVVDLLVVDEEGREWRDVVMQPEQNVLPDPNVVSVVIEAPTAEIDAIEADATYYVQWREVI